MAADTTTTPTEKRSGGKGAAAAAGTTMLATIVVWLLGRFHVSLSAEDGSIIAGALSTIVLFVWHYGLWNIWRQITRGDEGTKAATAAR